MAHNVMRKSIRKTWRCEAMKTIRAIILGVACALLAGLAGVAYAQNPVVSKLEVQSGQGIDRVVLHTSMAVPYKSFRLENPPRLVIDMPVMEWQAIDSLPAGYTGEALRNIRIARFNVDTTRMVFDLAQPASLDEVSIKNIDGNFLMVYDVTTAAYRDGSKNELDSLAGNSAPSPAAIRNSQAKPPMSGQPDDWGALIEQQTSTKPVPAGLPFKVIPLPVMKPAGSLKPMVVIDAGHGGRDPGATGVKGTQEKRVTLAYAKDLAQALLATGRYEVTLTRTDDTYIMLRERLAIGRRAKADIFISIHADSAGNSDTRGLSIYTLSETASDKEAAALATRENKVDLIYGLNLSTENKDVTEILIDLAQRETKNKSTKLADIIVEHVGKRVQLLRNTHRYAGFAVLKAPDVPSVLIELGFLSNRKDEALITSSNYRRQVIASLVSGIDAYFEAQRAR